MPRQVIELIGSPGVVRDTPATKMKDSAFSDAKNVRFADEGVESLVGDMSTFSSASITPVWIKAFPPITAPRWVYADLAQVFVYESTTHTEITRLSGNYNAIAGERWQATVLNGTAVLNNTIDVPQGWADFNPATKLVDLANWTGTKRAKSIKAFKNYLVALYIIDSGTDQPYRVLWSDSASAGSLPGSWDTADPATDAGEFDLAETPDYLVDQLVLGDINVIYKEYSTWGMQFIGPPFYFRFWKILSSKGLLHRDCMINVPFGHVVVTQDDIIVHGGQVEQYESVLDRQLRRWLFSSIDPTNFKNSFMLSDPKHNEVYFCFPQLGSTYADQAIVWNWGDKSSGVRDLTSTPFGTIGPIGESIVDDVEWGV